MDNMITISRMEGFPVPPIAPPPMIPVPTPPTCTPPENECCRSALAMAYVPMQQWRNLYEPDVALARGTLFAELDKPFTGEEVRYK